MDNQPYLGMNLAPVNDWGRSIPFLDVFKGSRPWVWSDKFTPITNNIDPDGWLTDVTPPSDKATNAIATTLLFTNQEKIGPTGRYIVSYDGEGEIKYRLNARKIKELSSPGRDCIEVSNRTNGGVFLEIVSTDPGKTGNYIRNIRIFRDNSISSSSLTPSTPGETESHMTGFNPQYLKAIAPFSVIRFMDWMRINGSAQENWMDRSKLTSAQWTTEKGIPVEAMIDLINQTDLIPWFNIPHRATDEYVREFAKVVRDKIRDNRKIYIEYSNEVWNTIFPQTKWVIDRAAAENLHFIEWFARRSAEVCKIWKEVLGDRAIGVLSTQAANVRLGKIAIDYLKKTNNLHNINAIAIAPYFGSYLGDPKYLPQLENFSLDDLFLELTMGGMVKKPDGSALVPSGALSQSFQWMRNYRDLTSKNNLPLIAYEGGQHLAGYRGAQNSDNLRSLFTLANQDPRMGELYRQYLLYWYRIGGGLFCHYNDMSMIARSGSWGAMEHLNDTSNPKYRALIQFSDKDLFSL